jgi:hypothetical protein
MTVEKAVYNIAPQALRQTLPNSLDGGCDVQYEVFLDKFKTWGHGYASSDFEQEEDGLLH